MLPAEMSMGEPALIAWDGDESFAMDAVEALYYEVVSATWEEWVALERARYRLLKRADDFRWAAEEGKRRRAPCQHWERMI
jgi:hypothetical protein